MSSERRHQFVSIAVSAALHAFTFLIILIAASRAVPAVLTPERSIEAFIVPPPEHPVYDGLAADDPVVEPPPLFGPNDPKRLTLDEFSIDLERIVAHASVLFPFITPGLALDYFEPIPPGRQFLQRRESAPEQHRPQDARLALTIDERSLQSYVDRAWSRQGRWTPFQRIASIIERHDPDAGDLPRLVQRYREQNWLQPYRDAGSRDPRFWTELNLAADHVDFIGFIRRYTSAHPSTRTTTELLFLLDDMAVASHNLLTTLLATSPTQDLVRTRAANPRAFAIVDLLKEYYKAALAERGLTTEESIASYYDALRLDILGMIVRTTPHGYRQSDARYLIGTIYWSQGNVEASLQSWRQITIDPTDSHVATYRPLLALLNNELKGVPETDPSFKPLITRMLGRDDGRWVVFSYDRLKQFGYRFDTF